MLYQVPMYLNTFCTYTALILNQRCPVNKTEKAKSVGKGGNNNYLYLFYWLTTILQIRNKEEKLFFFLLNMAGFEQASSCYKHHWYIY